MIRNNKWLLDRPKTKRVLLSIIINPIKNRPRLWLRILMPLYITQGRRSYICKRVRKDIVPFNKFILGERSVIEDFSVINNMVGNIIIGKNSRVGLANTIIGPVTIGNNVIIAQNVTIAGMDHLYKNILTPIIFQDISTDVIKIDNDVWIGANVVIIKGVSIGEHSVIAAGSVVIKDVPSLSVVAGNPARVVKAYNKLTEIWE